MELSLGSFHALLYFHSPCLTVFIFSHNVVSFHVPSFFTRLTWSLYYLYCLVPLTCSLFLLSPFFSLYCFLLPGKSFYTAIWTLPTTSLYALNLTFPNRCLPVARCWLTMVWTDKGWIHSADRNIKFFHFSSKTIKKAHSSMLRSSI